MTSPNDVAFARRALEHGWITAAQIEEVLEDANRVAEHRGSGIAPFFRDRGYLTPVQIWDIEEEEGRRIVRCLECGRKYNVFRNRPGARFACRGCAGTIVAPEKPSEQSKRTVEAPSIVLESDAEIPAVGTEISRIGRFSILRELGRGGMGVVYLARDPRLDREVALKVMLSAELADDTDRKRFLREARLAAEARHPNIVFVHDVGEDAGVLYIAMEYVEGCRLDRAVKRWRPEPALATQLVAKIARAVSCLHEHGIVHRDLKPQNVVLRAEREPILMDFGLARHLARGDTLTVTGAVFGTPQYMSPEQAQGETQKIGPPTDVWALGGILYFCLTGQAPFEGPSKANVYWRISREAVPPPSSLNPAVDEALDDIVLRCLAKRAAFRWPSAAHFAEALEAYGRGVRPSGRHEPPGASVKSRELLEEFREGLTAEERWLADQRALGRSWNELALETGEGPDAVRMRLARAVERVSEGLQTADKAVDESQAVETPGRTSTGSARRIPGWMWIVGIACWAAAAILVAPWSPPVPVWLLVAGIACWAAATILVARWGSRPGRHKARSTRVKTEDPRALDRQGADKAAGESQAAETPGGTSTGFARRIRVFLSHAGIALRIGAAIGIYAIWLIVIFLFGEPPPPPPPQAPQFTATLAIEQEIPLEEKDESREEEKELDPEKEPTEHPVQKDNAVESDQDKTDNDDEDREGKGKDVDAMFHTPFAAMWTDAAIGWGGGASGAFAGRFGGKEDLVASGGGRGTQSAVDMGLRWLAAHQDKSRGMWDSDDFQAQCKKNTCSGRGTEWCDPGQTGLALLAFLGAGHTHQQGKYQETVKLALQYLKDIQDQEGCFGPRNNNYMYNHAIACLAVAEAYGMTKSPLLKESAQRGIDFIVSAQNPGFGWRYKTKPGDNDTSVTGWVVMALKSAKVSELSVPSDTFYGAQNWLDSVTDDQYYRTGYIQRGDKGARYRYLNEKFMRTESCTAISIISRVFMSSERSEPRSEQGDLLSQSLPTWDTNGGPGGTSKIDFDYWYWGTLAMFQLGGDYWKTWNESMKTAIVSHQRKDGDERGSWDPIDAWGSEGGRVYATSVNVLSLEIYYRYARVFE
ncbi:MAG: protein kinase [Planctomycetes bacterium]|nr:protein kinase [Planctomycetota bacterium]